MKNRFSSTYPSAEGMVLCDGGLNNKFQRSLLPDNESPDCLNVEFTNGAVETRRGSSFLNTTSVGTFACDGLYTRHDRSGAETMVAWFNGCGYSLGGTTFTTVPSAQSVFTAGTRVGSAEYQNFIFFGNGYADPYKYDGAYFTRHGIPAPSSALAVSSSATGSISGDWRFKVTYVNSHLVEGDLGPATSTFTAASATILLSSLPVAPQSFGVSARRIYAASASTYTLLYEIADNSSTTHTVTTITSGATAPTDQGTPPKYNQVVYHSDRLFMNDPANPNQFWYSELGEPFTVPSTNFDTIGDDTSDLIRGFAVFGESLVIMCDKSAWMLYMPTTTPSDWKKIRIRTPYGSKSPFGLMPYDGKVMFPAMQSDKFVGFAAINGTSLAPSTTFLTVTSAGSDRESDRIEPDMFAVPEAYVGNISGVQYENKLLFALPYGAGATYNNRVYCFDYSISNLKKSQLGSWVPFTGWNASQFTVYGGNLYYGSSTPTGLVHKCLVDNVYSDSGSAINSYYWTKEFSGLPGEENYQKDFRRIDMYYEKAGDWYMNVGYRTDGDLGDGNRVQVDTDPGGSLWAAMVFGRDDWGGGQEDGFINQPLGSARGKRIQFYFSNQNTAGQRFKVSGFNFSYNKKGTR